MCVERVEGAAAQHDLLVGAHWTPIDDGEVEIAHDGFHTEHERGLAGHVAGREPGVERPTDARVVGQAADLLERLLVGELVAERELVVPVPAVARRLLHQPAEARAEHERPHQPCDPGPDGHHGGARGRRRRAVASAQSALHAHRCRHRRDAATDGVAEPGRPVRSAGAATPEHNRGGEHAGRHQRHPAEEHQPVDCEPWRRFHTAGRTVGELARYRHGQGGRDRHAHHDRRDDERGAGQGKLAAVEAEGGERAALGVGGSGQAHRRLAHGQRGGEQGHRRQQRQRGGLGADRVIDASALL